MYRRSAALLARIGLLVGLATSPSFAQVANVPILSAIDPPAATIGQATEWAVSGRNLAKVGSLVISGGGVEVIGWKVLGETSASARIRVAPDVSPGYREVRLDGPSGVSNLAIIRVDRLGQVAEVEPNDEPANAQEIAVGSAVVGVLKPSDLDHFRIRGTPGRRVTLDLEARRIGTSLAPVVTLFSESGRALTQGRESRGGDRDCRMSVVIPPEGAFVVQVRDNLYGGSDQARYRLRVDPAPFATGLFPMGGEAGQTIEVELACGGGEPPRRKRITLPLTPGSRVDPGDFDGPGGPVSCPSRMVVGDGPERIEPPRSRDAPSAEVASGVTINGRIGEAGEVDSYRVKVKAGDKIRARVEAESLGSWLDSVLEIRGEDGVSLAQNDDSRTPSAPDRPRAVSVAGIPETSTDSTVDYEVQSDGVLTIELADRFGGGGPEYGYRLSIGPARSDFAVTLLLGNANANARAMGNLNQARAARTSPGQFGVFNLKPGSTVPINFVVTPEGRPGPVEIRVEGLPDGVSADPVAVRLGAPPSGPATTAMSADASSVADFLLLKVAPDAQPGLGEFRVIASSTGPGPKLVREASATIGIDSVAVSGRPITRTIARFSLRVVGEARARFVGPPAPPTLRSLSVPGPLLQGDRLDLALDFSHAVSADDGSLIEARAEGVGLSTNTVISAGTSADRDESARDVVVHVLASIKAELGPHVVKVSYTAPGRPPVDRAVTVEVKAPIEVRAAAGSIFLNPGDTATLRVEVLREKGFDGEVELKVEGLPRGVKAGKGVVLGPGMSSSEIRLEMNAEARPIAKPAEVRVVGMARMPRGNVSVDSKIRPMIEPRVADK